MMHPDAEIRFIEKNIGYGLFARRAIPRGTITWAADDLDRRFSETEVNCMSAICREQVLRFSYVDRNGFFVLCHDLGRYVNHSCAPNCLSSGFDFEFAIRDVAEDEQICDEYGLMNLDEKMACLCGSAGCRGSVGPGDFDRLADEWDMRVGEAFPYISRVEQPLWPLVTEKADIEAVLRGEAPVPTCRLHELRTSCARAGL
jgi:hypothetical protein